MTNYNFEVCFICHFPTTDWSANESGEPICGLCWSEMPTPEEEEAVYFALAEHWEEEMIQMLADH